MHFQLLMNVFLLQIRMLQLRNLFTSSETVLLQKKYSLVVLNSSTLTELIHVMKSTFTSAAGDDNL